MVKEYVASLDVSVYFLGVMQVLEALQDSVAYAGDLRLTQRLLGDLYYVCDRPRVAILED